MTTIQQAFVKNFPSVDKVYTNYKRTNIFHDSSNGLIKFSDTWNRHEKCNENRKSSAHTDSKGIFVWREQSAFIIVQDRFSK